MRTVWSCVGGDELDVDSVAVANEEVVGTAGAFGAVEGAVVEDGVVADEAVVKATVGVAADIGAVAAGIKVAADDILSAVMRSKVVLPLDPPVPRGKALKGGDAKWKRICLLLAFEVVVGCFASA